MKQLELTISSEADTERFGQALAGCLPEGTTVCLIGTLGAGKTRLVQAVATACGIPRGQVVSPTFTLCNEYPGAPAISHLDLYRIADEDELLELGLEEYFDAPALTFVEWADRFPDSMPPERLDVCLEITGETSRQVRLRAIGTLLENALADLQGRWQAEAD